MSSIHELNDSFPFDKLQLSHPTIISGGNHFIKFSLHSSPLYVKPPKCFIKGSISKTTKRSHCDLMFSNQDVDIIKWMEDLEGYACKQIYSNRERWFESDMELSDIENYFASPLKSYKSGKNHLIRTNIPTRLGKLNLKIYDENEEEVDPDSIAENTSVMTILEVQGIKCSARSFQIEFEIKQMLRLDPVDIFEKCILLKHVESDTLDHTQTLAENTSLVKNSSVVNQPNIPSPKTHESPVKPDILSLESFSKKEEGTIPPAHLEVSTEMPDFHANTDAKVFSDLPEFDVKIDDVSGYDPVHIKDRKDVYYELYKEARKKARISRNLAFQSYLEAREIKTKYDLDDIESDEEDKFYNSFLESGLTNQ